MRRPGSSISIKGNAERSASPEGDRMSSRVLAGFFTIMTFGAGTVVSAQTIGGGAKGGVVFSTVTGDIGSSQSKSLQTGGTFGGFVTIWFNDMWAFQPEVNYVMGGVKSTLTAGSQTRDIGNHI